jgi:polyvinyl alcohol dehydrogenase (cytochrome)
MLPMTYTPRRMVATVAAISLAIAGCGSSANPSGAGIAPTSTSSTVGTTAPTTPPKGAPTTTGTTGKAASHPDKAVEAWPGYQANPARTAAVQAGPSFDPASRAWSAALGGAVYGQVLVADGRVFAATENNRVVALDPHTGKLLWSASLGAPLTNVDSVAGCGDIDPLGITSTPVVDVATHTLYVVGEVSGDDDVVHHRLEGIDLGTGRVKLSEDIDPPLPAGEQAINLLQRASLALGNGRVYVSYGGNDGDCGHYHGWIVGVDQQGAGHEVSFEVASDGEGGAIWEGGGGPALGANGDLYVTTGNANPDPPQGGPDPKKYTESVVKLTPQLKPIASFKDKVAGGDEDLSTGNPVLLPDGDVFAVGKTDIGYVLKQDNLSEVAAVKGVCGSDPDGGPAYDAATNRIFIPCRGGGIQELDLANNTLGPVLHGSDSTAILIGNDLWAMDYPLGAITEYDATTGATLQTLHAGSNVPTFASPSTGLGLLLVPTTMGVTAFRGPR